jgi:hypothetical protein
MKTSDLVRCLEFPCEGVNQTAYIVPDVNIDLKKIKLLLVSESAPQNPADYYYAKGVPLYTQTTLLAFQDAGIHVESIHDLIEMGVYLTTAVKCGKIGYNIKAGPIRECSKLLETELNAFPNLHAILLMGDVAIKALNYIAKRQGENRVIPAGSTYKIRGQAFSYKGIPTYPSYLQAGPSFFIEKSKRRMIAEDITSALAML